MPDGRPLRVAIVGAGPAGLYAAGHLLSGPHGTYVNGEIIALHDEHVEVDVLERLPTPWGLVRGGVAPDHPEKKMVSTVFDAIANRSGFRFFGNVDLGRDVGHRDLMAWYDAVIYAVGADDDTRMGIAGEELPGCHAAREFVAWYNGHPDYASSWYDFSGERAIVVGNGNVALDIARILTLSEAELRRTDIADHAIEALRKSRIREVVVLGRRGVRQAAFNNPELEELGTLDGVDIVVEGDDPAARPDRADSNNRLLDTLRLYAESPRTDATKRIVLRFLTSPIQLRGDSRVESIAIARNELVPDGNGILRARTTDDTDELVTGLVLRAVGYRSSPIEGLPFDERRGVIENTGGRVTDIPGAYVAGWIKRGPSGIIGTNKKCARDTVRALLEDYDAGRLPTAGTLTSAQVAVALSNRQS
ncbi:FAD-dependent oxidoreductase [Mycolicibacterium neoaurum]|uniref:FAD-dependent oxidoreductase n=1 Tax=Mycolicibacterium neoaurum TaxID=1795 RepID=UPI001BD0DD06|nr:FAD-dependent oxidoreductase [Mycolicibacterium neoaurum]QVI30709.1 FAD-dependent oxidoreductase [Mycolicibacterium neoaurum]